MAWQLHGCVIWPYRTYTLAIQNIHPDHTQTPSPMEPYGVHFAVQTIHRVMAWRGMAWCRIAWHGVVWRDVAWHAMLCRDMAWCAMARCGMAWQLHGCVIWPYRTYTLAIQNIYPDHTQTRALWSPMGFIWLYKTYTQTTPSPEPYGAPWASFG